MTDAWSLPVVDARRLDAERRAALRPGELVVDERAVSRRLPCFFYEVASWQVARETQLAPNFGVWEFMEVDLHETSILRAYPRDIPCAVLLLAAVLSVLRQHLNQPMWISANGGYRSPSHSRSRTASTHCWGTAVNIYRVGDEWLDTRSGIERVADVATRLVPALWARPFCGGIGFHHDHPHLHPGLPRFVSPQAPGE